MFEEFEVSGTTLDEIKDAIADKLMEGYDEMVMEVDDPRDIMVSKEEARKLAHDAAGRSIEMQVASGILRFEMLNQSLGNEPAPWFREMMRARPSDYVEVIARLADDGHECPDCSNDDDD